MAEPRVFAVGDVHGCVDELECLLASLNPTAADTVVFLGDYIDRGPDSRAVIDLVLAWRRQSPATVICLKGNHEDMALGYLGRGGLWGEAWRRNGGAAALRSYGVAPGVPVGEVLRAIPDDHLEFLESLALLYHWGGYLFVHAGIRPGQPLECQRAEDLLWIREEFTHSHEDFGVSVVFGHTPYRRVLDDRPRKVGIDTGCVYGGALTCLVLPDASVRQVPLGERSVRRGTLAG